MMEIRQQETFETRAARLVASFRESEAQVKSLCLELYDLHTEFLLRQMVEHEGRIYTSFYDWMQALGLARSTAFNYLNAGVALKAGLDPDGTRALSELYDLGAAIRHGATREEVETTTDPARLSEAKRNQGLVGFKIPQLFAPEADALAERLMKLELAPSK
ncbi:MAG: hypothetical protein N2045_14045, partial [Fimbriimonadales bacterium]|nr:hypothetical protein [Fimbriimonadales bacterium]